LNGFTAQISVLIHHSADPRWLCPRHARAHVAGEVAEEPRAIGDLRLHRHLGEQWLGLA
jgi:hypothetical protein